MKNITKIILGIFLFVITYTHAAESNSKNEDLITQMSEDQDVKTWLSNGCRESLLNMSLEKVREDQLSPETIATINQLKMLNIDQRKIIFDRYPVLNTMNIPEKINVLEKLLELNNTLPNIIDCITTQVGVFGTCFLVSFGVALPQWQSIALNTCLKTAVAADLAAIAASGGTATPEVVLAASPEVVGCLMLARVQFAVTGGIPMATCISKFISQTIECFKKNPN